MTQFQPWIDFKDNAEDLSIPVYAPPCPGCMHWKPQKQYVALKIGQVFDGVVLCHSEDMHQDFSCYRAREG